MAPGIRSVATATVGVRLARRLAGRHLGPGSGIGISIQLSAGPSSALRPGVGCPIITAAGSFLPLTVGSGHRRVSAPDARYRIAR
jgi:hypothetical protein